MKVPACSPASFADRGPRPHSALAVVPSAACTAEAVVVFLSCWIVVPRGGIVVLDRFDMSRVNGVRGVEQAAGDGLLDESAEDIVSDVFEIGEKPVNGVSGWRFVESAIVPDKTVLKFSCNWTRAVDILVVAVQKAAKEVWWFVNSCSPPRSGGEHVVLQQELEVELFKQRHCLGSRDIQEVLYRSYVLQGVGTAGHSFQTLRPPLGGFL